MQIGEQLCNIRLQPRLQQIPALEDHARQGAHVAWQPTRRHRCQCTDHALRVAKAQRRVGQRERIPESRVQVSQSRQKNLDVSSRPRFRRHQAGRDVAHQDEPVVTGAGAAKDGMVDRGFQLIQQAVLP